MTIKIIPKKSIFSILSFLNFESATAKVDALLYEIQAFEARNYSLQSLNLGAHPMGATSTTSLLVQLPKNFLVPFLLHDNGMTGIF